MTAKRRSAPKRLPQYLHTHRKRMGLSQREVGTLLGLRDGSKVSRYERGVRLPPLLTTIGLAIIFRAPLQELFGGRYDRIERDIACRARRLLKKLSPSALQPNLTQKRAYLSALAEPRHGSLDNLPIDDSHPRH